MKKIVKRKAKVNLAKLDPTRTLTLRKAFAAKIRHQFARLKYELHKLIVEDDAFGLKEPKAFSFNYDITHNIIRKLPDGKYRLYSKTGGNLGTFDSKEAAEKHEREVEYFKRVDNKLHQYASTQFDINDQMVTDTLTHIQDSINPDDLIERETKPHITVRYGLHDEPGLAAKVTHAVAATGIVTFKIGRLSVFSSPEEDVLKFEVEGNRLHELNTRLALLPHTDTHPDYKPHLTVAYLKPGTGHKYIQPSPLTGKEFIASRLTFSDRERNKRYFTTNASFKFETSPQKLQEFQKWLRQQFASQLRSKSLDQLWKQYIIQGFSKGAGRAFDDTTKKERLSHAGQRSGEFLQGGREQFLKTAFGQPIAKEKVELLVSRTFSELDGMTEDMIPRLTRTLADGLVQGLSPRDVAKNISDALDISRARAENIARTEIIRSHAEGQLTALEQLGVEEVGVAVEWTATPDHRVCPKCESLEGVVLKLSEAHGKIPHHPGCRCTWIPANVGEDRSQIRSKKEIESAFMEAGEVVKVSKNRPESILNRFSEMLLADNIFCPTGIGGGIDPTCTKGDSSTDIGNEPQVQHDREVRHLGVKRVVEDTVKDWKYKEPVTIIDQDGPEFERGGVTWREGGNCKLSTGEITIHSGTAGLSVKAIERLTSHELMHGSFEKVHTTYRTEQSEIAKREQEIIERYDAANPGVDLGTRARALNDIALTRMDGSLKPEYEKEYPTYTRLLKFIEHTPTEQFIKDDGITPYSEAYWKDFKDGKVSFHIAVHETLAEIAGQHAETGKVVGSKLFRDYYKATRDEYRVISGSQKTRKGVGIVKNESLFTEHTIYLDENFQPTNIENAKYLRWWKADGSNGLAIKADTINEDKTKDEITQ